MSDGSLTSGMKEGENTMISFDTLSELTGFPVERIKDELLLSNTDEKSQNSNVKTKDEEISLGNLRSAMLQYLNTSIDEENTTSSSK
jgi:hypothetical protein